MTEGEIGFRSGDREVVLGPGGYITKPRGETHTMWNAGKQPARMIEVISPAGVEHFFWARRGTSRPTCPTRAVIAALAAEHGLEFGDAPWLDDVIERYHLTPAARAPTLSRGRSRRRRRRCWCR